MRKGVPPPKALNSVARAFWRDLQRDFPLDDAAGQALLLQACYALDRAEAARAQIDREGATVRDRFGQLIAHPATRIERDSRAQLLACLRALNLDIAPARPPGRPLGS